MLLQDHLTMSPCRVKQQQKKFLKHVSFYSFRRNETIDVMTMMSRLGINSALQIVDDMSDYSAAKSKSLWRHHPAGGRND